METVYQCPLRKRPYRDINRLSLPTYSSILSNANDVRTRNITRFGLKRARMAGSALAAALMFNAAPAAAQTSDSEQATAEVNIVRPLSFFKTEDLEFGRIIAGTTAGTVRIYPNGTRTSTGGVTLVGNSSEYHPAGYAGKGGITRIVLLSMGATSIWIYNGSGQRMRVRNFEIGSTPTAILDTSAMRFSITNANGVFEFPVGATLDVGANQAQGAYTGTYTITATYL